MPLLIHARSHPGQLVDGLCDQLALPLDDPFQSEVVAVPTRGIERWLTERISLGLADRGMGDGICANVAFPSPRRLIDDVLSGVPALEPTLAAWNRAPLARRVALALDAHLEDPTMHMLARYVSAGGEHLPLGNGRRWRAADKIAGLFDRYSRRRPLMVRSWSAGHDVGPAGRPLAPPDVWQPVLWRHVRELVDVPSPAEVLPGALEPIRLGSVDPGLPSRLFVYGLTAADPADLDVLEALAVERDVHLYVLHPSPEMWRRTALALPPPRDNPGPLRRAEDPTRDQARHPLLRSWAQETRELQVLLTSRGHDTSPAVDAGAEAASLLERLQKDIRDNVVPDSAGSEHFAGSEHGDRSIQIHVCHGARRQVEVLRDAVLHALAADPTLEPRDIVIMTPDLATFAPLLEAAFPPDVGDPESASGERRRGDSLPDLRVRIADRAPAVVNPLVRFAGTVFDLAGSRLEAGTIKDLVGLQVVRQRFGFDASGAEEIADVIDDANISWGLDGDHRAQWDGGPFADQTWRRGLDRALAGAFYSDGRVHTVATIAPLDGVEGQEARPVGHLAQILDRIGTVRDLLLEARPRAKWGATIATAVRLLAAPAWGEEWQWGQLERLLEEVFAASPDGSEEPEINAAEARLAVDRWSQDVPSPLHFRSGDLTVCTLVPMRSVPYRVVCLLGMDDERFPRSSRADGDDLLVDDEVVGDVDRGAQDRQLLLDAVLAAGEHLIVTYSGRDELTNAVYPPAVPVAELRDTLYEMIGRHGLQLVVSEHPLQAFSDRNFTPGHLGVPGPWSYDPMQLDGALAVQERAEAADRPVPLPGPLEIPNEIRLEDLIRFLLNPTAEYVRYRLGFRIPKRGELADDTLPDDLNALERWHLTTRLLDGLLDGHDVATLEARERGADALPPGELGSDDLEDGGRRALELLAAARRHGFDRERQVQLGGAVDVGRYLVEGSVTVDPLHARAGLVTASKLKGKQSLRAFTELAFLTALRPDQPWHSLLIGRLDSARIDRAWTVTIGPLGKNAEDRARAAAGMLATLVELYAEGLSSPILLPCESAYQWQQNIGKGFGPAYSAAANEWEFKRYAKEADEPATVLLFGSLPRISDLAATGFPAQAARLWGPIIPVRWEKGA